MSRDDTIRIIKETIICVDKLLNEAGFKPDCTIRNHVAIISSMLNGEIFNPDWSELEACRDSLRDHMQMISILKQIISCLKAALVGVKGMAEIAGETSPTWKRAADEIGRALKECEP